MQEGEIEHIYKYICLCMNKRMLGKYRLSRPCVVVNTGVASPPTAPGTLVDTDTHTHGHCGVWRPYSVLAVRSINYTIICQL